jgi:hypothetical protein
MTLKTTTSGGQLPTIRGDKVLDLIGDRTNSDNIRHRIGTVLGVEPDGALFVRFDDTRRTNDIVPAKETQRLGTPLDIAKALDKTFDHLTVEYGNTGGNINCIVAQYTDADGHHPTDYLDEIIVGSDGPIGWSDGDGDDHGYFDDIDDAYGIYWQDNSDLGPLGADIFARIHDVLVEQLPPRPANDYNGVAIVDVTMDETGRYPVDPTYYPKRVREAVANRPTHHGPWCDEDDTLVPCEACASNDGNMEVR